MEKLININGKNIYPISRENFDALLNYYFIENGIENIGGSSIEDCFKKATQIELFEFEYIADLIIRNLDFFKEKVGNSGITITNLCSYGLDAYLNTFEFGGLKRNIVTKSFQELMIRESK